MREKEEWAQIQSIKLIGENFMLTPTKLVQKAWLDGFNFAKQEISNIPWKSKLLLLQEAGETNKHYIAQEIFTFGEGVIK